jgi:hypothetical protein
VAIAIAAHDLLDGVAGYALLLELEATPSAAARQMTQLHQHQLRSGAGDASGRELFTMYTGT